ncbi:DUF4148 domain-containing protein [Paraburkholderia saeva]|jgi:hypothetical protein|uniref:DUF4148 domain-containing protein n=1 Tax=Paraburkholderia saeva TaxID=2777537 RepID=A0A9N8X187_9BURK|nr:DUF4148 domain-containing protein [Paraburkholderia saeva]CAG4895215.1 hypothetical protein LMG31841_02093 [Paraburkholderia saeva]CAG4897763.1 hypothetical protein R70241_02372 [Paraburkholderia saeva]
MKRNLFAGLALSLLVSAPAFADGGGGGIGHAGSYNDQWWSHSSVTTRAEVKAGINDAYRDGTLPALNKTSYPEQGLIGRTQAERLAVQAGDDGATRVARAGQ